MKKKVIAMIQELHLTSPENKSSTKSNKRLSNGPENVVVGSYTYKEIRGSSAYVDKTMLIKDFVDSSDKVLLITCPRRFGKSSNMDMIKTFLQMKVDASGNQITDLVNNENYKIFKEEINNKGLKIMEDNSFVNAHFANHPVIFVNFKDTGKGKIVNVEDVENRIKIAISDAFMEHNYMKNVFRKIINSGNEDDKEDAENYLKTFRRICDMNGVNATHLDIQYSLTFLCEILYNHFGKQVYVLMDEYDAPTQYDIWNKKIDVEEILNYVDGILWSVFKDNKYLEKGLMTGVSSLFRGSHCFSLNNVSEYKYLFDPEFSKYYGFTEDEVI